jgi:DnaJ-class molecular chaperone
MEPNYYAVLGVPESASHEAIQEAYRRLVKAYHPDRSGADTAGQFRAVQEAWETLGNPERRREYDRRHRPRPARPERRSFRPEAPGRGRPFAGADDALHLELQMSRAEARAGGDVAVDLPAWVRCRHCGGSGRLAWLRCPGCGGRGRDLVPERFTLHVPAGLADGAVVHVPLEEYGLAYGALVVHVCVV